MAMFWLMVLLLLIRAFFLWRYVSNVQTGGCCRELVPSGVPTFLKKTSLSTGKCALKFPFGSLRKKSSLCSHITGVTAFVSARVPSPVNYDMHDVDTPKMPSGGVNG